jgi:hypothetical protein
MARKPKLINPGDQFNHLTVIKHIGRYETPNGTVRRIFECKCSCGSIKTYEYFSLRKLYSCGCKRKPRPKKDIIGKQFGRLVVLKDIDSKQYECLCSCGKTKVANYYSLISKEGGTKSCGCLQRDRTREHSKNKKITSSQNINNDR